MAGKNARGIATPGRPPDGEWEPEPKRRRRLNGASSRAAARSASDAQRQNRDGEQDGEELGTEHSDDDRDELEEEPDRGTAMPEGPKFPRNLNPAHHPVRLVLEERCQRCTERKSEYCSVAGAGGACLSCKVAKTSCSLSNSSRGHSNHLSRIAQANNPGWYLGMRNGAERALNDRSEARMRSRRRVLSLNGAAASRAPIDAERSSSNPGGHTGASASTSTTDQAVVNSTSAHTGSYTLRGKGKRRAALPSRSPSPASECDTPESEDSLDRTSHPSYVRAYVGRSPSASHVVLERPAAPRQTSSSSRPPVLVSLQIPPPQPLPSDQRIRAVRRILPAPAEKQPTVGLPPSAATLGLSHLRAPQPALRDVYEPTGRDSGSSCQVQALCTVPLQTEETHAASSSVVHSSAPQVPAASSSSPYPLPWSLPPPPPAPALLHPLLDVAHSSAVVQSSPEGASPSRVPMPLPSPPPAPKSPRAPPSVAHNHAAVQTVSVSQERAPSSRLAIPGSPPIPPPAHVSLHAPQPVVHNNSPAVQTATIPPERPSSLPVFMSGSPPPPQVVRDDAAAQTGPPPAPRNQPHPATIQTELRALRTAQTSFADLAAAVAARADADLARLDALDAAVRDVRGAMRMLDERVRALEPQVAGLRAAAAGSRMEWHRRAEGMAMAGQALAESVARIEGMVGEARGVAGSLDL